MLEILELQDVESRLPCVAAGDDSFNRGGLVELFLLREADVVSIPAYTFSFDPNQSARLSGTLLLRPGAQYYRFRFSPDTGGFNESQSEDDHGPYFDQSLVVSIPKDRPEITWLKWRMRRERFVFLYRDQNGIVKYLPGLRAKFDLDTRQRGSEYNGHVLTARRAALTPALHWQIAAGASAASVFAEAALNFALQHDSYPGGIAPGQLLNLEYTPVDAQALRVFLNNGLLLRLGTDYQLQGNNLLLSIRDTVDAGGASTVITFYPYNGEDSAPTDFGQHTASLTATYSSGQTITLPATPMGQGSLLVTYNNTLVLRYGEHYTLSGDTVTLLFGGTPSGADPDTFTFHYVHDTGGSALAPAGYRRLQHTITTSEASGYLITLPQTPITDSLFLTLDSALLLRPGTDYNLSSNEIELLFATEGTAADPVVLDVWYAY